MSAYGGGLTHQNGPATSRAESVAHVPRTTALRETTTTTTTRGTTQARAVAATIPLEPVADELTRCAVCGRGPARMVALMDDTELLPADTMRCAVMIWTRAVLWESMSVEERAFEARRWRERAR